MCNSNGEVTNTTYTVKEIHIPKSYVTGVNYQTRQRYDYALLTVATPLSTYTHYTLGTPVDFSSTAFTSINLFISGFPQDAGSANPGRVYTSKGHGMTSSNNDWMSYDNHTASGLSGSPVYTATKYKVGNNDWVKVYTAIAIHGYAGGHGPTMNEKLLTFFMQGSTNVGY